MLRRVFIAVLFCLLSSAAAHAQCTGSGVAWSCAAGSSTSQVQSAINSSSDGAVLTFASGNYSWSSTMTFSLSKGTTLLCVSAASCTVSTNGTVFAFTSGSSTKLYRISGFNFSSAGDFMVWTCPSGGCAGTITQFRFDHNTLVSPADSHPILLGENTSRQYVYGVIDHNSFSSSGSTEALYVLGATDSAAPASPQGTGNNMFFEDNTITSTSMTDAGLGSTDGWGAGSAVVIRHNTITNGLVTAHAAETPGAYGGGFQNLEVYNNHVIANSGSAYPDGYRLIHHQGSNEGIYFNNTFTAQSSLNPAALSITANYVDSACSSYPCAHQPGRDYAAATLMPIYTWNNRNTTNGSNVPGDSEEGSNTYVAPNRDYFTEVTSFNGTVGVGFGTLANRPATCTHSNSTYPTRSPQDDGHGGVGYFATDVGAQGTLYTCTATNTWTVYYQPYTYPHPLVSGSNRTGTQPAPPTGLTVQIQ